MLDKDEIRKSLTDDNIFELLEEWGGMPEYNNTGIVSDTICHNKPNIGSRKLYYYKDSKLFKCYTECASSFDIFELYCKISAIQNNIELSFRDSMLLIAKRFNLLDRALEFNIKPRALIDQSLIDNYNKIKEIEEKNYNVELKEYDSKILDNFNYSLNLQPWIDDGIAPEVMQKARIGYYPGENAITIPHYDINNRFIGLRGRTLSEEDEKIFGKYHPLKINQILYNHPLGMNLYGLNWSKDAIKIIKKVIIVEGEKSVLQYASYFGWDNNICVACCGSNISVFQMHQILDTFNYDINEIIIAFDRQFQEVGDSDFLRLKDNLLKIRTLYNNNAMISFIFDKNKICPYKSSPLDCGKDIFLKLFNERIIL